MGLPLVFVLYPSPRMGDIADDRLPTGINVDVFDNHFLATTAAHVRQRIYLGCERPLQARQCQSSRILLR